MSYHIKRNKNGARRATPQRAGITIVYVAVIMVAIVAMASLAVDLARVQVCKTELRRAADAAARYGARGLANGSAAAIANAITAAGDNSADGSPIVISASDVQVGNWDTTQNPHFSTLRTPLNAVMVTCSRTAANGNATPLMFGRILGKNTCDATAVSIAMANTSTATAMTLPVLATANPWLAGMPSGTSGNVGNPHNNPDNASVYTTSQIQQALNALTGSSGSFTTNGVTWNNFGTVTLATLGSSAAWVPNTGAGQSPMPTAGLALSSGSAITFDSVAGNMNHNNGVPTGTPDGDTTEIANYTIEGEHGIANVHAPINALMGVFLNDNQPDTTGAPADLDFSTQQSRNFDTLSPQLKQVFFIGDGRNDNGNPQQFVVPPGATRLFLGSMDDYEWSNNNGSFSVTVHNAVTVTTVQ